MIGYTSMLTLASITLIKYIKIAYPPSVIQMFLNSPSINVAAIFPKVN